MDTTRGLSQSISDQFKTRKPPGEAPYIYDQIILGGGPAGLTAAVYSARKRIDLLLLTDDIGGQMLWTSDIENYMGYYYITAKELIDKFHSQVEQFPIDLLANDGAVSLTRESDIFHVQSRSGKHFCARTLIVASGKRSRSLNVPGEKDLIGHGISYCAISDGPCFKGMDVAIIGGGNSGLTVAVNMLPLANKICCVNNSTTLRADGVLVEKARAGKVEFFLGYDVKEIVGKGFVEKLVIRNRESGEIVEKPVRGVFVEIGLIPNSEFCDGFLKLNQWKEIIVDSSCQTDVSGVYASGDVTDVPEKQIIVAAGEGAKASLGAYQYLLRKFPKP